MQDHDPRGFGCGASVRLENPVTFDDLCERYGEPRLIPNADLYDLLTDIREDLAHRMLMGEVAAEQIRESLLGQEVRRRSKQDLLWLAGYFLWETNPEGTGKPITDNCIRPESHGVLCEKFAVQKDDTKPLADQSPIKTRLVLWPRGGQKSTTLTIADTVQWILNFPDIRILFLTAASDLAVSMLDEAKGQFVVKEGAPSLMNLFFPEFCREEKDMGNEYEFTCPVWERKQVRRREPTILAAGIDSTLSGKHFELIKGDDTVSNRNSESEEQCRKVAKNFGINKKMLRPFGYVDLIGTRYSDVDMYGDIIEKNVGNLTVEKGVGWDLTLNPDMGQMILVGRAIQIKPEVVEKLEREGRDVSYVEAGADGCELLLPDILTYKFLCGEYAKDELAFESQMNQNPKPPGLVTFDRPLMLRNTVPYNETPEQYVVTQMWDFAISTKKGRDYSTACAVRWDNQGRMFVCDLVRDRLKPADLAKRVVEFAAKHKPEVVAIEDAAGARFLEGQIRAEAIKTGDPFLINLMMRIRWITPDNQKDAKKARMGALHPWLTDGRLKFLSSLPQLEVLYSEFEKCLISHHHDDIPDVISYQPQLAPRFEFAPGVVQSEDPWAGQFDKQTALLQAGWNLLFEENCDAFGVPGRGVTTTLLQDLLEPQEEDLCYEPTVPGWDPILGAGLG